MNLKDKLQIIVITYNRCKLFEKTLNTLLAPDSPVKDFNILVLDNNSTDDTAIIVQEKQKNKDNLSYIKNKYNLGIGGNIAKALEVASMQYVWILADDDIIDWSAWPFVEEAVEQGKEIISASRADYLIKERGEHDIPTSLLHLTFVSSSIYKTSIITDTTMANIINNIYTLFPHLVPPIEHINKGGEIYILPKSLVKNGMLPETDCSYIRGYESDTLYLKQRTMSWIVGYANIISHIKDKKLRQAILQLPIHREIHKGWLNFYNAMYNWYWKYDNRLPVYETAKQLNFLRKWLLYFYMVSPIKFYSTKNAINISIFGIIKTKILPKFKK